MGPESDEGYDAPLSDQIFNFDAFETSSEQRRPPLEGLALYKRKQQNHHHVHRPSTKELLTMPLPVELDIKRTNIRDKDSRNSTKRSKIRKRNISPIPAPPGTYMGHVQKTPERERLRSDGYEIDVVHGASVRNRRVDQIQRPNSSSSSSSSTLPDNTLGNEIRCYRDLMNRQKSKKLVRPSTAEKIPLRPVQLHAFEDSHFHYSTSSDSFRPKSASSSRPESGRGTDSNDETIGARASPMMVEQARLESTVSPMFLDDKRFRAQSSVHNRSSVSDRERRRLHRAVVELAERSIQEANRNADSIHLYEEEQRKMLKDQGTCTRNDKVRLGLTKARTITVEPRQIVELTRANTITVEPRRIVEEDFRRQSPLPPRREPTPEIWRDPSPEVRRERIPSSPPPPLMFCRQLGVDLPPRPVANLPPRPRRESASPPPLQRTLPAVHIPHFVAPSAQRSSSSSREAVIMNRRRLSSGRDESDSSRQRQSRPIVRRGSSVTKPLSSRRSSSLSLPAKAPFFTVSQPTTFAVQALEQNFRQLLNTYYPQWKAIGMRLIHSDRIAYSFRDKLVKIERDSIEEQEELRQDLKSSRPGSETVRAINRRLSELKTDRTTANKILAKLNANLRNQGIETRCQQLRVLVGALAA